MDRERGLDSDRASALRTDKVAATSTVARDPCDEGEHGDVDGNETSCASDQPDDAQTIRQQLLKNNPRRRKIVANSSGRKINLWRANIEQLRFALNRDASNAVASSGGSSSIPNDNNVSSTVHQPPGGASAAPDKRDRFKEAFKHFKGCLLYTSPSPRDRG